jgi:hypothetical protein
VTVHHGVTIHGSAANRSAKGRPALSIGYNPADALPYTAPAYRSSHFGALVRGAPARFARHDPVRMRLPPDWSGGYTSIFAHQKGEDPRARGGPQPQEARFRRRPAISSSSLSVVRCRQ